MFLKKELCSTCRIEHYNKIADTLAQNGIKFSSVTNSTANPDRYRGVPISNNNMLYLYRIFVSRKDFESATQLLEKI